MPPVRTTPPPKPRKQRKNHKRLDNVDPERFENTLPRMSLNSEIHPSTSPEIQSEDDAFDNMSQHMGDQGNFIGSASGSGNSEPRAIPSLSQNGGPPRSPSDPCWPQALSLYAQPRNSHDTGMPNPHPPYSVDSGNVEAGAHQFWSDNAYQPPTYAVHPDSCSTRSLSSFTNPGPQAVESDRRSTGSLTSLPNPQNPSTPSPYLLTHPQAAHDASNPFTALSAHHGDGAQVFFARWPSSSSSMPMLPDVDNNFSNFQLEEFSHLSPRPIPGSQFLIQDHETSSLVPSVMDMGRWSGHYHDPESEEGDETDAT